MALRKRKSGDKAATKAAKHVGEPKITPKKAKNALGVAKVLGPTVIPVVAPLAVKAADAVRERFERRRAHKLGIAVDDLPQYSGRGGALHARISGAASSINELRGKDGTTDDDRAFADEADIKLRQLAAAVRAAERMPTARRKAAHRAVATELDQIEQRLLHRLGV
ncbi:hypothetical protein EV193_10566 [Herbihabitans rhizosphaerae]|uniref:Uncharacterized protein n=1 Tax=Herbihabitans rhizosphaerae TaxID=1872711 RepID=A0A4Q7KPA5_9PSEU|nr:DUF6474 family protein [Herbihabitans rhizosphaerae]RZS37511.1 hypothetical protein EV193_10566 [Herbihabitans rhizosphaerae]